MPQLLALLDRGGIHADGGVVEEVTAVDLADVHLADVARGDRRHRLVELDGNAEIVGEMVEGAERKHAEGHGTADENLCRTADGPVAAADDDHVRSRLGRSLNRGPEGRGAMRGNQSIDTCSAKSGPDSIDDLGRVRGGANARGGVEEDEGSHASPRLATSKARPPDGTAVFASESFDVLLFRDFGTRPR
jgi:hypothetical protein